MSDKTTADSACSVSRRQAIAGIALAFGSLAAGSRALGQNAMDTQRAAPRRTSLHYEADFKVGPERIYDVLLDPKQFADMTGRAATIDPTEGGAFSLFGGLITGRNVELVPNQRIVQAWRPTHWDSGIYSIVRFEFREQGSQARMLLDHTGFPEAEAENLDSGWKGHYLNPLAKYLS
jgi:activator of HSP90 ATPase